MFHISSHFFSSSFDPSKSFVDTTVNGNATQLDSSITLELFHGVVDSRSICQHWETSDDAVKIYEPTKRIHFMWKVLAFRESGQNIIRNYASTTTHSGSFVSTPKSRQNVPAERETTNMKNPIKTTLFGYNNYRFMSAIKNLCILNSARSSLRKKMLRRCKCADFGQAKC